MSKMNDGGPAFPFVATDRSNVEMQTNGMSLRDWIAGQALAGCLASPHTHMESADQRSLDNYDTQVAARIYRLADAMLAERAKGGA